MYSDSLKTHIDHIEGEEHLTAIKEGFETGFFADAVTDRNKKTFQLQK